ncbi:MAG: right-handed parallel beta-helix repeat-containing protein, partial [Planctomycetales bacterium]|nr:right-handed parallel beta-helix repeat-containing protein [Planctomycetales bacterium]
DSTGQGCRHLFTTSGEGVTNRYGTSRHVLITDITASANGENDSTLPLFDTHGEGWAVIFQNLHITIPTEKGIVKAPFTGNANRAIQTRSRGTVIRNCYIQGSGVSNAILVVGADCKIENCHISNCWRGIRVQNDPDGGTNGDVDRCIIRGNRIINCTGSGVYLDDGTAHLVQGNDFNNCGQGSSGESASAIYIDTTTPDDIQITGNNIPNTGNEFAVGGTVFNPTQVTLSGNNLRGYSSDGTSTDSGFDPASSAAVSLETEATTYNFTD